GLDVDVNPQLADDFRCTQSGPITDIHLWGGFQRDQAPDQPGGVVFELTFFSDIPATADAWSRPGQRLWTRYVYPGQYSVRHVTDGDVGWFGPQSGYYDPFDHWETYQYNFCIDKDAFIQEAGRVYWLGVRARDARGKVIWFGWRNTLPELQWNDAGVYLDTTNSWQPLVYPDDHEFAGKKMDLAFVITGDPTEQSKHDLGDAPDSSNSSAGTPMTAYPAPLVQAHYPTVYAAGSPAFGPLHLEPKALAYLGPKVTLEIEADLGPDEDPSNNILPRNDAPDRDNADDSIVLPLVLPSCESVTFDYDVTVTQLLYNQVFVNVWFDWNRDGDWDDVVDCENGLVVPEWAVQNQAIPLTALGMMTQTTPPFMSWHPLSQDERNPLWMRITLAERPWGLTNAMRGGAGPQGGYQYGETEDYLLYPRLTSDEETLDWGDAPDGFNIPQYPTLAVHNGASHVAEGPWFGDRADQPDTEADGQAHAAAFGDDLDIAAAMANDDEDGVSMPPLVPGTNANASVMVNGGGGVVQVWVDFDADSQWKASEEVYNGFLPDGVRVLSFSVPSTAVSGTSFARFRISRKGGLGPDGPAPDGEVEDHLISIWNKPPDVKWLQRPDITRNGIDIRLDSDPGTVSRSLADDFECSCFGRITNVHLWGSWRDDKKGEIQGIRIRFRPDDPIGPAGFDAENRYSKPGPEILWEQDFAAGQFQENLYHMVPSPGEWWWDPLTGDLQPGADRGLWEVHIPIDPDRAFLQRGTPDKPIIYWLEVSVVTEGGEFGWKTRRWPDHFMDDAVLGVGQPGQYHELRYPKGHPYHEKEQDSVDLAFYLTCQPEEEDMPTFKPASVTQCPPIATLCPTVVTRCPAKQTACPSVQTVCPAVQTKCPAMATVCPPKQTQCPPVDTRCPVTRTKCPSVSTLCPSVSTQCPAVATECFIRETVCPSVETKCPPTSTKCPPVATECFTQDTFCPAVETRCPPVETRCPPTSTKCPPIATECFTQDTFCPSVETRCPPTSTKCPPVATECFTQDTFCPSVETRCPPVSTKCPPVATECFTQDTFCPAVETRCPPVETRCPPLSTKCPPVATECFTQDTFCPPVETRCPPLSTKCPPVATECFTQDTFCPSVETRCPPVSTKCPPVATECFTQDTFCPSVETRCPPVSTKCPPVATECFTQDTFCPSVETRCPPVSTKCPPVATECFTQDTFCPSVETRCPPVETQCPTVSTKCPAVATECYVLKTTCPPVETQCPAVATSCPSVRTQCPSVRTQCPAVVTQCISTPDCGVIGSVLTPLNVALAISDVLCPEVDAKCPTVLAAAMLYQPMKAPRVAMAGW
ncbi:MAG: hypothetical protein HQ515_06145, partial [Phycisphaeraceae bacterium]|nr:hypothetical protein [Phycisphaeraceae bacterium]